MLAHQSFILLYCPSFHNVAFKSLNNCFKLIHLLHRNRFVLEYIAPEQPTKCWRILQNLLKPIFFHPWPTWGSSVVVGRRNPYKTWYSALQTHSCAKLGCPCLCICPIHPRNRRRRQRRRLLDALVTIRHHRCILGCCSQRWQQGHLLTHSLDTTISQFHPLRRRASARTYLKLSQDFHVLQSLIYLDA